MEGPAGAARGIVGALGGWAAGGRGGGEADAAATGGAAAAGAGFCDALAGMALGSVPGFCRVTRGGEPVVGRAAGGRGDGPRAGPAPGRVPGRCKEGREGGGAGAPGAALGPETARRSASSGIDARFAMTIFGSPGDEGAADGVAARGAMRIGVETGAMGIRRSVSRCSSASGGGDLGTGERCARRIFGADAGLAGFGNGSCSSNGSASSSRSSFTVLANRSRGAAGAAGGTVRSAKGSSSASRGMRYAVPSWSSSIGSSGMYTRGADDGDEEAESCSEAVRSFMGSTPNRAVARMTSRL